MANSFLKKMILEELKNVLSEQKRSVPNENVKKLQLYINISRPSSKKIAQDGIIGPETIRAISEDHAGLVPGEITKSTILNGLEDVYLPYYLEVAKAEVRRQADIVGSIGDSLLNKPAVSASEKSSANGFPVRDPLVTRHPEKEETPVKLGPDFGKEYE